MAFEYFSLFELPVSLQIDPKELRQRYFRLSRQFHPDFNPGGDAVAEAAVLEQSAQLNKAYKTLGDSDALLGYVLREKGLLPDDEKYPLDPGFLMEMMELNESVADAAEGPAREAALNGLNHWKKEIYEPVAHHIENYQEAAVSEKELLHLKDYYYKRKYLQRLAAQLGQKL